MKIRAEVIEVSTNGETLTIKLQGGSKRWANWRRMGVFQIQVPDIERNCRTYHLGKIVRLAIST